MSKLPMYIIMTLSMGLGGYLPVLFGASAFDIMSVVGTVVGGIGGIALYAWLHSNGILE